MGYVDFETDNAFYRLHLVLHGSFVNPFGLFEVNSKDLLDHFDAQILEMSGSETSAKGLVPEDIEIIVSWYIPTKTENIIKKNGTPVFLPDVKPKSTIKGEAIHAGMSLSGILLTIGSVLGTMYRLPVCFKKITRRRFLIETPAFLAAFGLGITNSCSSSSVGSPGEIVARKPFKDYTEYVYRLFKEANVEGRNAVNAEKIDGFIAPLVGKRIGKKPTLELLYGAAHSGIEHCLKDAAYRKEVLKAFSPPEEYYYPENLRGCFEITVPDSNRPLKTKITQHTGIIQFPQMTEKELSEVRARAMELEARINGKQGRVERTPMDRRGFMKMLAGRG